MESGARLHKISPGCNALLCREFWERFRGGSGHSVYRQGCDIRLGPGEVVEHSSGERKKQSFICQFDERPVPRTCRLVIVEQVGS